MYKLSYNKTNDSQEPRLKIVPTLFITSIVMLSLGVLGLVEHKSPENLASLNTLSSSFIAYFEYHAMIFMGALGFTLAVWIKDRN